MKSGLFLKGLNEIRAIAALGVLAGHLGIGPKSLAPHMVTVFFVLSGFLISFLLLCEKKMSRTIDVRKFYIRRTLRIWPLYFTYIAIVIFMTDGWSNNVWLYLFFAGNLAHSSGLIVPHLGHYWSLGVEEQFYSFWPWIAKYAKSFFLAMVIVVLIYSATKIFLYVYYGAHSNAYEFIFMSKFQSMAIGGVAAYFFLKKHRLIDFILKPGTEIFTYILLVLLFAFQSKLPSIIHPEIFSLLLTLILIQQVSDRSIIKLRNKILNFLGVISFGIYVYHPLIIYIMKINRIMDGSTILFGIMATAITLVVSCVSYLVIEKPFLTLKGKFSVVTN